MTQRYFYLLSISVKSSFLMYLKQNLRISFWFLFRLNCLDILVFYGNQFREKSKGRKMHFIYKKYLTVSFDLHIIKFRLKEIVL